MTGRTPVAEQPLVPGDTTPWATASARLETPEKDRTYWLATVRPDGRPHIRPILGLWLDDAFYFITGETTRKAKNLQANPQCVLTASSLALPALDVIIKGDAVKVTDHHKVQQVVDAYASRLHWPLTVGDGGVFGPTRRPLGHLPMRCSSSHPRRSLASPALLEPKKEKAPQAPSARPAGGSKQPPTPPPLRHPDRHAVTVPAG